MPVSPVMEFAVSGERILSCVYWKLSVRKKVNTFFNMLYVSVELL